MFIHSFEHLAPAGGWFPGCGGERDGHLKSFLAFGVSILQLALVICCGFARLSIHSRRLLVASAGRIFDQWLGKAGD